MGKIVIISVLVFLLIVLLLVSILLYARKKLVPQGDVKININSKKDIEVQTGSSILATLANEKIFLPSACGGQGTCGMCKCKVIE
ncbi:MAG: 2Fe-2S iron-sulfur cluster-binding protein, partial [Bacteroidales bacterium]|nr:2Fe-2S iron-sulfur cluster-binding protein [Bacteroidales bacterium]